MSDLLTFSHKINFSMSPAQLALFCRKVHHAIKLSEPAPYDLVLISAKMKKTNAVQLYGEPARIFGDMHYYKPADIVRMKMATPNSREVVNFQQTEDGRFDAVYRGHGELDVSLTNYYANLSRVCVEFNPFGFFYLKLNEWASRVSDTPAEREPNFQYALGLVASADCYENAVSKLPDSFVTMVANVPKDHLQLGWRGLRDILNGVPVPRQAVFA